MDAVITAAAQALAQGKPLDALNQIALRDDASGLALRGIAMAQIGDLSRARLLLRRAARAFGQTHAASRARCVIAEAEIALVSRELNWASGALEAARKTLEVLGDTANAAHARHIEIRRLLLIGHLEDAGQALEKLDPTGFTPALRTAHELALAGIAMRRLQAKSARSAIARAKAAADHAGIPALSAEVENTARLLSMPAARLIARGTEKRLQLEEVETLLASETLVVDACRYAVRDRNNCISLARRPVLFTLACALGEAWPRDVSRDALIARAFRLKLVDDSHRTRLRVEIGRLRKAISGVAGVSATKQGFILTPNAATDIVVLARPIEEKYAALLAFLADGASWSSSALALAMGTSQRTVQRALDSLAAAGKVQSFGRGRARRWIASPVPGFTTTLLLPGLLPND